MLKFKKSLVNTNRISNFEDRSKYILNLDRNEKILSFSKEHKRNFSKYINSLDLNLYPNLNPTYDKLSKYLKINKENILITEGVSGAIKNILDSIVINRKTEIIAPRPSFALYNIYTKIYNLKVKNFSYDNYFNLNINNIFKLVTKNTSVVFLTYPNIPVEGDIKLSFIKKLAKFLDRKGILLAIDEVYYPFNKSSAITFIKKYSNLVVMRSFSKAYGLAGARVGYMVSNKNKIKIFSNTKGGYETNMMSAQAIHFALDNYKLTKKYIKDVRSGFFFLKKKLKQLKINYYGGTNSNFIFVDFNNYVLAKKIFNKLKEKKIMVRHGFLKPFDKGILLTGCPPKQMKKFFFNFEKIYK